MSGKQRRVPFMVYGTRRVPTTFESENMDLSLFPHAS